MSERRVPAVDNTSVDTKPSSGLAEAIIKPIEWTK